MYQTRLSVAKDVGIAAEGTMQPHSGSINPDKDRVSLYIQAEKLDDLITALEGCEVVVPERTTFYGAREFGVREPGGTVVLFAEFAAEQ